MTPTRTSPEVIQRLSLAVNQVLGEAATMGRLRDLSAAPQQTAQGETLTFLRAEQKEFPTFARAGKIEVEWSAQPDPRAASGSYAELPPV